MSWMRQQQAAKQAKQVKKPVSPSRPDVEAPPEATKEFSIWLATAKMDWDRLKAIPDHAERDRLAPSLLEKYREFLTEWMARGEAHQNNVLVMNIVWAVNAHRWDVLLPLADYAVKTEQVLTFFDRDLATFVADSVKDYAETLYKTSQQAQENGRLNRFTLPAIFHQVLERLVSQAWAVNFVAVAKYHKLAGLEAEAHQHWEYAVHHYRLANKYPNVGVKTRLEEAEKQLLQETGSSPQATRGLERKVAINATASSQSSGSPVLPSDGQTTAG